jgi:hypothetical protein
MGSILPINVLDVDEPDVNLMNQGGGLERVSRLFGGHVPLGEPMQLVIDQRHKFLE